MKKTFNEVIRIKAYGDLLGSYTPANRTWLNENYGKEVFAYKANINYYHLENGMQCHVYDCHNLSKPINYLT